MKYEMPEQLTYALKNMLKAGRRAEPIEYSCSHMGRSDLSRTRKAAQEWLKTHRLDCEIRAWLQDSTGYVQIIPVEHIH